MMILTARLHELLWRRDWPICCGKPVTGACHGGQAESICCGDMHDGPLDSETIVATLRVLLPEDIRQSPCFEVWVAKKLVFFGDGDGDDGGDNYQGSGDAASGGNGHAH